MKKIGFTPGLWAYSLWATLSVAATTSLMLLIGRALLGEAVIGLLYLVPIAWSASRWGKGPGMSAALAAALLFDFFFIPPFHTFTVARPEGWLVLAIFLGVAAVVVERIQAVMSKGREAVFMYELSSILANARTQEAVAYALARYIRQLFQASVVSVAFRRSGQSQRIVVTEPQDATGTGSPDRILPILNAWGLVGEIQIWRGEYAGLPSEESLLFRDFASQAARAFERARSMEAEDAANGLIAHVPAK